MRNYSLGFMVLWDIKFFLKKHRKLIIINNCLQSNDIWRFALVNMNSFEVIYLKIFWSAANRGYFKLSKAHIAIPFFQLILTRI
jgi:hypothetical protein